MVVERKAGVMDNVLTETGAHLLAHSPISVVVTNPHLEDNPIVFVNAAFEATTGYSRAVALGRNCRFLQGDDENQPGLAELRRAIKAGEATDVKIRNYTALGDMFINHLHISPVRDSDGNLIAFVGMQIRRDTETVRAREDQQTIDHLELLLAETNGRMRAHLRLLADLMKGAVADSSQLAQELLSHRVEALGLLYEDLAPDALGALQSTVSAGEFVSRIAATLSTIEPRQKVRYNIVTDYCLMGVDRAALLGLIVTEVLTILMTQVEGKRGHNLIGLELTESGSTEVELKIRTDFPDGPKNPFALPDRSRAIIQGLVDQLNGSIEMTEEDATTEKGGRAKLRLTFGSMS